MERTWTFLEPSEINHRTRQLAFAHRCIHHAGAPHLPLAANFMNVTKDVEPGLHALKVRRQIGATHPFSVVAEIAEARRRPVRHQSVDAGGNELPSGIDVGPAPTLEKLQKLLGLDGIDARFPGRMVHGN